VFNKEIYYHTSINTSSPHVSLLFSAALKKLIYILPLRLYSSHALYICLSCCLAGRIDKLFGATGRHQTAASCCPPHLHDCNGSTLSHIKYSNYPRLPHCHQTQGVIYARQRNIFDTRRDCRVGGVGSSLGNRATDHVVGRLLSTP
jgi:hypothetical protein